MSIATKTGDLGFTGLMYNRRVPKSHPRVEAYGTVDELNASLGLARATNTHPFVRDTLFRVQERLITLMGELATAPEDLTRYASDGFPAVDPEMTSELDKLICEIEAQNITYKGWALPGDSVASASLDLARTTCRRAERKIHGLTESGEVRNPEILIFLNRLSDALWLLARWTDNNAPAGE